jgi:transposase
LPKLYADSGHAGPKFHHAPSEACRQLSIEIVKRSDAGKFVVLPKRWIVERSIGWLNRRRPSTIKAMRYRYDLRKHMSVRLEYPIRQPIERMTNCDGRWASMGAAEQVAREMQSPLPTVAAPAAIYYSIHRTWRDRTQHRPAGVRATGVRLPPH